MKKFVYSVIVVLVIGLGAFVIFLFYSPKQVPSQLVEPQQQQQKQDVVVPSRQAPTGNKTYESSRYHFSLFYPEKLSVKEYEEGDGAQTITFQNVDDASGFQIFVTPYSDPQVTAERLKQDIPSGVRNNLKNISIDGAVGASFFSTDALLGDTAEIWFIKDGYLYEVTTLKDLTTWLEPIVQTWQFI